jgi:hypothetical protein
MNLRFTVCRAHGSGLSTRAGYGRRRLGSSIGATIWLDNHYMSVAVVAAEPVEATEPGGPVIELGPV